MHIDPGQMNALRKIEETRFVDEMFTHIRASKCAEAEQMPDASLRATIRMCIADGHRFGFTHSHDIARLVQYRFRFGPDYCKLDHPIPLLSILSRQEYDPKDRLNMLDGFYGTYQLTRA